MKSQKWKSKVKHIFGIIIFHSFFFKQVLSKKKKSIRKKEKKVNVLKKTILWKQMKGKKVSKVFYHVKTQEVNFIF